MRSSGIAGRRKLFMKYNSLYKRLDASNIDLAKCFYCDTTRECLDHVPPLMHLEHVDIAVAKASMGLFLVPSCHECNNLLGAKMLLTLLERLEYLAHRYEVKASRYGEDWSDHEISQLGWALRKMIENSTENVRFYTAKAFNAEIRMSELLAGEVVMRGEE